MPAAFMRLPLTNDGVTAGVRQQHGIIGRDFARATRAAESPRRSASERGPTSTGASRGRRSTRRAWPLRAARATCATMSSQVRASRRLSPILKFADAGEVSVAFDEAGDRELSLEVDDLGGRSNIFRDFRVRADGVDVTAGDGYCFGDRPGSVHRNHFSITDDEVRRGGRAQNR